MAKKGKGFSVKFDSFATKVTYFAGSPQVFISAFALIIIWGATGPIFSFSDTWQLIINTSTTIITFLMVFVIQQSQNKDTMAIQLKLNELIASHKSASNRLIDIEDLTSEELEILKKFYIALSKKAKEDKDIFSTHSLDEAKERKGYKLGHDE
ncbi:MAG: low affinity iron permease family protein [Chloroflexota bacterium]